MRAHLGLLPGVLLLVLLLAAPLPVAARGADRSTEVHEGVWPLDPEPDVVRGFEPPAGPYAPGHRGVDLAGAPGQPVLAALPGTIGFAGSVGGTPVVTVLHGGRRTTYEPVVATLGRGEQVAARDVLGRLTVTDSHCFPAACLHWGLIEDETYLDPLTLVAGGPVRLLPLWREDPAPAHTSWAPPLELWRRPLDWLA
jgi:murein DD-endopeptidase MepM/ murein hydrolase activator NlpD